MKIIVFLLGISAFSIGKASDEPIYSEFYDNSTRQERMFPFLSKDSYSVETCMDQSNAGICLSALHCKSRGGRFFNGGICPNGNVCCQLTAKCSTDTARPCIIKTNGVTVTHEDNNRVPYKRTYRYVKTKGVCQIRLDFDLFELDEPDSLHDCTNDIMSVRGFSTCGKNTGQHIYINFGDSNQIDMSMKIHTNQARYNIRSTFIGCKSERRAPAHCLQYFTANEDTVRSFSFGKQQNRMDYTVCVEPGEGVSQIQWRPCVNINNASPFYISGGGPGDMNGIIRQPAEGVDCKWDWIQIFGLNRLCGFGFTGLPKSSSKPFMMFVHFDEAESRTVSLPTDPTQGCDRVYNDPYTGGTYTCSVDLGVCTCLYERPSSEGVQLPSISPVQPPDNLNTGFCLEYAQLI